MRQTLRLLGSKASYLLWNSGLYPCVSEYGRRLGIYYAMTLQKDIFLMGSMGLILSILKISSAIAFEPFMSQGMSTTSKTGAG